MIKNYILDTNVLLQDPESINSFKENCVIIPIGVLEELDKFKKEHGVLGKNSREICRRLDELRLKGDLRTGVDLNNGHGGKVRVIYNGNLNSFYKEKNIDLHVLHISKLLTEKEPETECIIISKDINVRIRANALGLKAENYESDRVKEEIDKGYSEIFCDSNLIQQLSQDRHINIKKFEKFFNFNFYPNFYLIIKSEEESVLAKISPDMKNVEIIEDFKGGMRIKPKNVEQTFVIDALLDDRIKLVSIVGNSGTGKTLLSCAVGYYLLSKTDKYQKLLVSRPMVPLSNRDTVGFIPGELLDKIDPWMKPIYDSFEVIYGNKNKPIKGKEFIKQNSNIEIEILSYIRGRSINNQFFIVDEAQGTTALEVKTIITRAGENTKIILTGDIDQIDNPYLDKFSNGLTVATNAFIGSELSAHIVMTKGIRSRLSEEASHRL